jgi:hypothetical protein
VNGIAQHKITKVAASTRRKCGKHAHANQPDPSIQHIRNGRAHSAHVHVDVLFEAYFNACLKL